MLVRPESNSRPPAWQPDAQPTEPTVRKLVITRSRHKARENVHSRATIGFGFASDWLKKWRENLNQSVSEVMQNQSNSLITFDTQLKTTLLHSVIGLKFSRHFFNQSEVKPKPIVARACTFSRALCRLCVITSSFDRFTGLSPSFLIGQSNYFGFGFTTLI